MGVNGIEGVEKAGRVQQAGANVAAQGNGRAEGPDAKGPKADGADVTGPKADEKTPTDTFSADDSALEGDDVGGSGGEAGVGDHESLDVDVVELDPGSVVDLSAGSVEAETLNLDVSDAGESTRTLEDTLVSRDSKQHQEEKYAEQARTRRDELTVAHERIEESQHQNQRVDSTLDAKRNALYESVDRAVSARHDLTMRSGTSSAAPAAASSPLVAQRSRSAEQEALQKIDVLDRYKVSTQMNLRNAEVQLRQNAQVQAQARENERQHVANGKSAHEQTQALRHLVYQMGNGPARHDRDASGVAQSVENEAQPEQANAAAEQPDARSRKRHDFRPADVNYASPASDDDDKTDDGAGQRLYGPAFKLQGDRNRLVLDLSRLDRPHVDVTA